MPSVPARTLNQLRKLSRVLTSDIISAEHWHSLRLSNIVPYHVFEDAAPALQECVGFPESFSDYYTRPS